MTADEIIANGLHLAHFNQNHDPKTGEFAKSSAGSPITRKQKKQAIKKLRDEQTEHFRSQISKEAAKVTSIGRNGYDQRGSEWNKAYRQGKVTAKDDREIKAAVKSTREYMEKKYGKELTKVLSKSDIIGTGTKAIDEYIAKNGGTKIEELLKTHE